MELVFEYKETASKFMIHLGKTKHQAEVLSDLKSNIEEKTFTIHIDFSENHSCKYFTVAQAMQFFGSRQQVTMYTGVYYYNEHDKTVPKPFCSVSQSLRHDSVAIWAHLIPVLHSIMSYHTVERVNFFSDSPTSQYRNKTSILWPRSCPPFSKISSLHLGILVNQAMKKGHQMVLKGCSKKNCR